MDYSNSFGEESSMRFVPVLSSFSHRFPFESRIFIVFLIVRCTGRKPSIISLPEVPMGCLLYMFHPPSNHKNYNV